MSGGLVITMIALRADSKMPERWPWIRNHTAELDHLRKCRVDGIAIDQRGPAMDLPNPDVSPRVSIITPAYNAARFLADTIDSVRAQTVQDWELIVVDDGSTDATVAIVQRYAEADPRIRLLRQANAGPSAARNNGMSAARGTFFAFLDSDDQWLPEFLECQLDVFARYPDTALVTANAYYLGGPQDGQPRRPPSEGHPVLNLENIIKNDSAVFIMTVFRREVFERIGGLDESQWTSEDYDFWIRAALAGFVFRISTRPLALYRRHEGSLSADSARMLRGILQTYGKARVTLPIDSPAHEALDRQMARFERELLLVEGKQALERRDYRTAANRLHALRDRGAGTLIGFTAWLVEHAPAAALLAYRLRGLRHSRLLSRRNA
jgi:teichuronic acid biosynthesis glycosyltransferase TuaG